MGECRELAQGDALEVETGGVLTIIALRQTARRLRNTLHPTVIADSRIAEGTFTWASSSSFVRFLLAAALGAVRAGFDSNRVQAHLRRQLLGPSSLALQQRIFAATRR